MGTTNGNSSSPNGGDGSGYSSGYSGSGSEYPEGGQTFVDTDGLHYGASNFDDLGQSFLSYANGYSAALTYEPLNGGPGDDEMWKKFAPSYKQSTTQFLAGVRELGSGLLAIARGVDAMADAYERTEKTNTELARTLNRLSPEVPGSEPGARQPAVLATRSAPGELARREEEQPAPLLQRGIAVRAPFARLREDSVDPGPHLKRRLREQAPLARVYASARPGSGLLPRVRAQGALPRAYASAKPGSRLLPRVRAQALLPRVYASAKPGSRLERDIRVRALLAPVQRHQLVRLLEPVVPAEPAGERVFTRAGYPPDAQWQPPGAEVPRFPRLKRVLALPVDDPSLPSG